MHPVSKKGFQQTRVQSKFQITKVRPKTMMGKKGAVQDLNMERNKVIYNQQFREKTFTPVGIKNQSSQERLKKIKNKKAGRVHDMMLADEALELKGKKYSSLINNQLPNMATPLPKLQAAFNYRETPTGSQMNGGDAFYQDTAQKKFEKSMKKKKTRNQSTFCKSTNSKVQTQTQQTLTNSSHQAVVIFLPKNGSKNREEFLQQFLDQDLSQYKIQLPHSTNHMKKENVSAIEETPKGRKQRHSRNVVSKSVQGMIADSNHQQPMAAMTGIRKEPSFHDKQERGFSSSKTSFQGPYDTHKSMSNINQPQVAPQTPFYSNIFHNIQQLSNQQMQIRRARSSKHYQHQVSAFMGGKRQSSIVQFQNKNLPRDGRKSAKSFTSSQENLLNLEMIYHKNKNELEMPSIQEGVHKFQIKSVIQGKKNKKFQFGKSEMKHSLNYESVPRNMDMHDLDTNFGMDISQTQNLTIAASGKSGMEHGTHLPQLYSKDLMSATAKIKLQREKRNQMKKQTRKSRSRSRKNKNQNQQSQPEFQPINPRNEKISITENSQQVHTPRKLSKREYSGSHEDNHSLVDMENLISLDKESDGNHSASQKEEVPDIMQFSKNSIEQNQKIMQRKSEQIKRPSVISNNEVRNQLRQMTGIAPSEGLQPIEGHSILSRPQTNMHQLSDLEDMDDGLLVEMLKIKLKRMRNRNPSVNAQTQAKPQQAQMKIFEQAIGIIEDKDTSPQAHQVNNFVQEQNTLPQPEITHSPLHPTESTNMIKDQNAIGELYGEASPILFLSANTSIPKEGQKEQFDPANQRFANFDSEIEYIKEDIGGNQLNESPKVVVQVQLKEPTPVITQRMVHPIKGQLEATAQVSEHQSTVEEPKVTEESSNKLLHLEEVTEEPPLQIIKTSIHEATTSPNFKEVSDPKPANEESPTFIADEPLEDASADLLKTEMTQIPKQQPVIKIESAFISTPLKESAQPIKRATTEQKNIAKAKQQLDHTFQRKAEKTSSEEKTDEKPPELPKQRLFSPDSNQLKLNQAICPSEQSANTHQVFLANENKIELEVREEVLNVKTNLTAAQQREIISISGSGNSALPHENQKDQLVMLPVEKEPSIKQLVEHSPVPETIVEIPEEGQNGEKINESGESEKIEEHKPEVVKKEDSMSSFQSESFNKFSSESEKIEYNNHPSPNQQTTPEKQPSQAPTDESPNSPLFQVRANIVTPSEFKKKGSEVFSEQLISVKNIERNSNEEVEKLAHPKVQFVNQLESEDQTSEEASSYDDMNTPMSSFNFSDNDDKQISLSSQASLIKNLHSEIQKNRRAELQKSKTSIGRIGKILAKKQPSNKLDYEIEQVKLDFNLTERRGLKFNKSKPSLSEIEKQYQREPDLVTWNKLSIDDASTTKGYPFQSDLLRHDEQLDAVLIKNFYLKSVIKEFHNSELMDQNVHRALFEIHKHVKKVQLYGRADLQLDQEMDMNNQLINIWDLNFNDIRDPLIMKKLHKNQAFLQVDDQKRTSKQMIRNSVHYKLTKYVTRKAGQMVLSPSEMFDELEVNQRIKHVLQDPEMAIYRKNRPAKQEYRELLEQDYENFNNHAQYIDMVWKKQINMSMFIEITNSEKLDMLKDIILIFTIKTKADVQGVYGYVDWKTIELKTINYEKQCVKLQKKIGSKLLRHYHRFQSYKDPDHEALQQKHIPINQGIIEKFESFHHLSKRLAPSCFRYQIGLCRTLLLTYVNNVIFNDRYDNLIELYTNINSKDALLKVEQEIVSVQNKRGMPSSFREYPTYHMIYKNDFINYNDILFRHNYQDIYLQLHDKEDDALFYANMELVNRQSQIHLARNFKKKQLPKSRDYILEYQTLEILKLRPRSRSFMMTEHEEINHEKALSIMFLNMIEKIHPPSSDVEEERIDFNANYIRNYKRLGAIDPYNPKACELIVMEILQDKVAKAKDINNLYFKRIYEAIQLQSVPITHMFGEFGYKCKLIRDPTQRQYSMEIFQTSLKHSSCKKIRAYEQKMRQITKIKDSFPEELHVLQKWQMKEQPKANKLSKEMKAIQAEEVHTDDSMKDINYEDLMSIELSEHESDWGSDDSFCQFKRQQREDRKKKMSSKNTRVNEILNMQKTQSALDYYQKLKKKLCQKDQKKPPVLESKSKVFKVLDQDAIVTNFNTHQKKLKPMNMINGFLQDTVKDLEFDNHREIKSLQKKIDYFNEVKEKCLTVVTKEQFMNSGSGKLIESLLKQSTTKQFEMISRVADVSKSQTTSVLESNSPSFTGSHYKTPQISITNLNKGISPNDDFKSAISPFENPFVVSNKQSRRHSVISIDPDKHSCTPPSKLSKEFIVEKNPQKLPKDQITSLRKFKGEKGKKMIFKKEFVEESSDLEIANELDILKELQEKKRNVKQHELRKKHNRLLIFKMMHNHSDKKENNKEQDEKNRRLHANLRLSKRLDDIRDKFAIKLNLELPAERKITTYLSKEEIEMQKRLQTKHNDKFKARLYYIIQQKMVQQMDDIMKRYYITSENTLDNQGNSLIALAAIMGDEEMVKLLLSRGLNPNTQNLQGDTPLHYAVNCGHFAIADMLITAGGKEHLENTLGQEPWEIQQRV